MRAKIWIKMLPYIDTLEREYTIKFGKELSEQTMKHFRESINSLK